MQIQAEWMPLANDTAPGSVRTPGQETAGTQRRHTLHLKRAG